jgi:hypothetical protein
LGIENREEGLRKSEKHVEFISNKNKEIRRKDYEAFTSQK